MSDPERIIQMIDITGPVHVEIHIRHDGRVVWVNVDSICRFRVCQIADLTIIDDRKEIEVWPES